MLYPAELRGLELKAAFYTLLGSGCAVSDTRNDTRWQKHEHEAAETIP